MEDKRYETLKQIRDDVLGGKNLPLYSYRVVNKYYPVIGQGDHYAKLIFIAEAPGEEEAKTGKPFVGASGKILDKLLSMVGIKREEIYITNIVKDRPPNNRTPSGEEILAYSPFLTKQLETIKPKIIVTLGRVAMEWMINEYKLKNFGKISQVHGRIFKLKIDNQLIKYIPMFHPVMALYDQNKLVDMEKDMKKLIKIEK